MLAQRARSALAHRGGYPLRITLYTTMGRTDRGAEVALEYLNGQGSTHWSPHPTRRSCSASTIESGRSLATDRSKNSLIYR